MVIQLGGTRIAFRISTPLTSLYRRHIFRACVSPAELYILKTCAENRTLNGYEELDPNIQNAIMENFQTGAPTVMTFAKVETPKAPCRARSRKKRSRQEITSDSEEDRRSSMKITRTENKGEDFSPEIGGISDLAAEVFEAIESSKRRMGIMPKPNYKNSAGTRPSKNRRWRPSNQ